MNRNPNNWVRILWSQKLMEIRVVVKGVSFAGVGTAWRHPFGRQVPYQRGAWCSIHEKRCFSYFLRNRNRRAVV